MNTTFKHQNRKKSCSLSNIWLIVASTLLLSGITSCVPPINGTTGQRAGKREVQMANTAYSKSKKYNGKNRQAQEENSDENYSANTQKIPDGTEYNDIVEFEKQLNNSKNNVNSDETSQQRTMPSLKEQLEGLEERQKIQDENIDNIKGDLLEIKSMLSDIATNKTKPVAASHAIKTVNNQVASSKDADKHNVIESEEANPQQFESENEMKSEEAKEAEAIKPDTKPKKAEEVPLPKKSKDFKIVKASEKKQSAKENSATTKEKPKAEPKPAVVANEPAGSKSVANDFSAIIATIAKKDFGNATKQIQEKMKSTSDADVIANCNYWLGECSFNQRDYAKSIEYYRQALNKQCDKRDVAQVRIAEAYLRVGKNSEAKVAYQTLLKEYPKSAHSPKAKKMLQQL